MEDTEEMALSAYRAATKALYAAEAAVKEAQAAYREAWNRLNAHMVLDVPKGQAS